MARAYTIAAAALALDVPAKWLDNTLSHNRVKGVIQERQGVARRLTLDALIILSVTVLLTGELGVPVARAIKLASELLAGGGKLSTDRAILEISIDLRTLHAQMLERLAHAVEVAPIPRRGRPPKSTTGRLE